jgi:hypothetical protein
MCVHMRQNSTASQARRARELCYCFLTWSILSISFLSFIPFYLFWLLYTFSPFYFLSLLHIQQKELHYCFLYFSLLFSTFLYFSLLFSLPLYDGSKIMEIEQMVDTLKELLGGREEEEYMSLIILHSMIEKEDQMRYFFVFFSPFPYFLFIFPLSFLLLFTRAKRRNTF